MYLLDTTPETPQSLAYLARRIRGFVSRRPHSIRRCGRLLPLLLCLPASGVAGPWYQEAGHDWHYRVPVTSPADADVHSQVVVDVDFHALLNALGIDASDAIDTNSPRVVRSNGVLAAEQEFTFHVYAGVLDAADNGRGELRFLLEDAPADGPYYLYFDIQGNGPKPANPALPVNGNFEHSQGSLPLRWSTGSANTGGGEQNLVQYTTPGSSIALSPQCGAEDAAIVDTSPNLRGGQPTGHGWHLLGYRDRCEDGPGPQEVWIEREIRVPAGAAAGALTWHFRLQGWDGVRNDHNFDWVSFFIDGAAIDPTTLDIDPTGLAMDATRVAKPITGAPTRRSYTDFQWRRASLDLTPYAGTALRFRVFMRFSHNDDEYRSWVMLDDVSWSERPATLGDAESLAAAELQLEKSIAATWDPVTGTTASRAIPGAWLTYHVHVTNLGPTSADTLQITDALDAHLALCVSSICHDGGPPVQVVDAPVSPPSGIAFDPAVDLSYSADGVTFDYVPAPDADGFDAAVRYLRLNLTGAMHAPAPDPPAIVIRYRVRVD